MNYLRSVANWTGRVFMPLTFLLTMHAAALAAEENAAAGKSWTLSWMLIVLTVALGLLVVLRPVGRTSDVKDKGDS